MANCSFVAVGARTHSSTISLPAGIQSGDLLLMCLFKKGTGRSWTASQTGWTSRKTQRSSDNFGFGEVYTRICDGTEGSSFNIGGAPDAGYIIAYRPASGYAFVEAPDAINGGAGRTSTGVTPSQIDDFLVYMLGATTNVNPGSITTPSGFTIRVNEFHNSFYYVYFNGCEDYASTSATGSFGPSTSGSSTLNMVFLFALNPTTIDVPFISSNTAVNAIALVGDEAVPFISSLTTLYTPDLQGYVTLDFISSVTAVYTPTLQGPLEVPFIGSNTVVFTPTLSAAASEVDVPFIASKTHVWNIMSLYDPDRVFGGIGNGGESFLIRLNANGVTDTATLLAGIGVSSGVILNLSGDGSFPTDKPFVVTIDDEKMLVYQIGAGTYQVRSRAISNTTASSHTAGASVAWGDSYEMAIVAGHDISHSFTADITSSGSFTYYGWLICFDSSQAYNAAGDRYAMHVSEVLGVFDAGVGSSGSNRCDAAQPNAVCVPAGVTDHCPAALSNPSLITTDIATGDVGMVRYTNPEAYVLDLGPRSVALQSWFGVMRVDASDNDVTLTDPDGYVVDTIPSGSGPGPFTGSVEIDEDEPLALATGIAKDASEAAGFAVATPNPVPWLTVTLPGADRYFTDGIHFSEKGWPIACVAVRQETRRVPHWESWDWRDYNFVYDGFGTDSTFCQMLINRNGIVFGSVPSVDLPGPQDIDGPDVIWDDPSYFYSACWYVILFNGPYLVVGPSVGGAMPDDVIDAGYVPVVGSPPGGGGSPPVTTPGTTIEGGEGGDISPSIAGLHIWELGGFF